MEERIKLVPFEKLSKTQFCRWVASCGIPLSRVKPWLVSYESQADYFVNENFHVLPGDFVEQAQEEAEDDDDYGEVDADELWRHSVLLSKELRRYLAKTPALDRHKKGEDEDPSRLCQEFLALLSEHWENRMDPNVLHYEFDELEKLCERENGVRRKGEDDHLRNDGRDEDVDANKKKDRYKDVFAPSHTRVELSDGKYINANFVKYPRHLLGVADGSEGGQRGQVIATQGPLQSNMPSSGASSGGKGGKDGKRGKGGSGGLRTKSSFTARPVEDTRAAFWQMVWETDSRAIFNLTDLEEQDEKSKAKIKCAPYWPAEATTTGAATEEGKGDGAGAGGGANGATAAEDETKTGGGGGAGEEGGGGGDGGGGGRGPDWLSSVIQSWVAMSSKATEIGIVKMVIIKISDTLRSQQPWKIECGWPF